MMMRIDYRNYRQPVVIWAGLAIVVAGAGGGAVRRARLMARRAGSASVGFGVQPSELAKIVVILFIAALLERRMDRIDEPVHALLPIGVVARRRSSG